MTGPSVERVLARLERVRRAGSGWLASCPAPDHGRGRGDLNPSLSVAEGRDGRPLLHCLAGCSWDEIAGSPALHDLLSTEGQRDRGTAGLPTHHVSTVPLRSSVPLVTLSEDAVERLAREWRRCPLPGHDGAAEVVREGDEWRLRCCQGRTRSLGEVRAAIGWGQDGWRGNTEIATWWRRLAHELAWFLPVRVDLPEVPLSGPARIAADGYRLLAGLRWADYPRQPVAYAARWVVAWCRPWPGALVDTGLAPITHRGARDAVRELVDADVIREAGKDRGTLLDLPGAGVPLASAAEAARIARLSGEKPWRSAPPGGGGRGR